MDDYKVVVNEHEIARELYSQNTAVLKYTIKFQQFVSKGVFLFTGKLNRYYKDRAYRLAHYCETEFSKEAVEYFNETVKNGYPFHEYELYENYTVTDSKNCTLSLYFDEGRYTGGANGTSKRTSDNWDLKTGTRIILDRLYPTDKNYEATIIAEVIQQISGQIKDLDYNYFDDYEHLAKHYFDSKNFYLAPNLLIISYQQITIAPLSSGTVVFNSHMLKVPLNRLYVEPVKLFQSAFM